jgi:hypothetical protein
MSKEKLLRSSSSDLRAAAIKPGSFDSAARRSTKQSARKNRATALRMTPDRQGNVERAR